MRNLLLAVVLLLSVTAARAEATADALVAYDQFFKAFTTDNHDAVTALFAPGALFFGTGSTDLVTAPTGIRDYFAAALSGKRGTVMARPFERTAAALSDEVVVISGKWQSERTLDGKMVTAGPSRNTVVMHKRGGSWLIAQFHNSPTPKPTAIAVSK